MNTEIIKKWELANISYSYDIIVYLFWIIIFLTFLKLLFSKNIDEYFKKIIGWLSILVFALVTENYYIIGISLFIGWLLIATENFLIHLAWIFSNKKWEDLFRLFDSFTGKREEIKIEELTEREKINELKKEKEENNWKIENIKNINKAVPTKKNRLSINDIVEKEKQILNLFENSNFEKYKNISFKKNVRLDNKYWRFILDGVLKKDFEIILWIEIKFLGELWPLTNIFFNIRKYIEKIRFMKFDFPFVLVLAAEKFELNDIEKIKEKYSNFEDINIIFYQFWKNKVPWTFIEKFSLTEFINNNEIKEWVFVEHPKFWIWKVLSLQWELGEISFQHFWIKRMNIRIAPLKRKHI